MGTLKGSMGDVATGQHWSAIRADDDIQSSVTQFLEDESVNLRSKSLSESVVDVSRWLGSQIQRERDGWAYKVRMAMQEIESHRRETLKIQGLLQECTDQLRTIAGYANIDEETLEKIAEEEPKRALPMYIECISVLLNDLVEDRLRCLQIMKKKESDGMSISHILQSYLHKMQLSNDIMKKDLTEKISELELEVFKQHKEGTKIKRQLSRKNDEIESLQLLLHKTDDHVIFDKIHRSTNTDQTQRDQAQLEKPGSPGSMKSAPTPISMTDSSHIQISEERLHKLRRSAKKLESSLQDALSQMDSYRKEATTKYSHASLISTGMRLKPLVVTTEPEGENEPSRSKKASSLVKLNSETAKEVTKSPRFEVSGKTTTQNDPLSSNRDKTNDQPKKANKLSKSHDVSEERRHRNEEREKMFQRPDRIFPNQSQQSCTFKSLVRSLDEMRTRRNHKVQGGKVSKCLRCQKLFKLNDNHKKACCFHPRMKERVEEYSSKGRLQRVSYVWQCCQQGVDSQGCCYGQHI